jgi:DNA-binding transcriptional ArsR family regulator
MVRKHLVELAFVSPDAAQQVAETMRALATPSRVRILSRLAAAPASVGQLASDLDLEQSAVSQQLRVLRHLRLVVGERRGRQIIYGLHDDHVGVLLAEAMSHTEHLGVAASRPTRRRVLSG